MNQNMTNRMRTGEQPNPLFIKLCIPEGLEDVLEGLAREVLRRQPSNINRFAAVYFGKLLALRTEAESCGAELSLKNLIGRGRFIDIDDETPMKIVEAEQVAQVECFDEKAKNKDNEKGTGLFMADDAQIVESVNVDKGNFGGHDGGATLSADALKLSSDVTPATGELALVEKLDEKEETPVSHGDQADENSSIRRSETSKDVDSKDNLHDQTEGQLTDNGAEQSEDANLLDKSSLDIKQASEEDNDTLTNSISADESKLDTIGSPEKLGEINVVDGHIQSEVWKTETLMVNGNDDSKSIIETREEETEMLVMDGNDATASIDSFEVQTDAANIEQSAPLIQEETQIEQFPFQKEESEIMVSTETTTSSEILPEISSSLSKDAEAEDETGQPIIREDVSEETVSSSDQKQQGSAETSRRNSQAVLFDTVHGSQTNEVEDEMNEDELEDIEAESGDENSESIFNKDETSLIITEISEEIVAKSDDGDESAAFEEQPIVQEADDVMDDATNPNDKSLEIKEEPALASIVEVTEEDVDEKLSSDCRTEEEQEVTTEMNLIEASENLDSNNDFKMAALESNPKEIKLTDHVSGAERDILEEMQQDVDKITASSNGEVDLTIVGRTPEVGSLIQGRDDIELAVGASEAKLQEEEELLSLEKLPKDITGNELSNTENKNNNDGIKLAEKNKTNDEIADDIETNDEMADEIITNDERAAEITTVDSALSQRSRPTEDDEIEARQQSRTSDEMNEQNDTKTVEEIQVVNKIDVEKSSTEEIILGSVEIGLEKHEQINGKEDFPVVSYDNDSTEDKVAEENLAFENEMKAEKNLNETDLEAEKVSIEHSEVETEQIIENDMEAENVRTESLEVETENIENLELENKRIENNIEVEKVLIPNKFEEVEIGLVPIASDLLEAEEAQNENLKIGKNSVNVEKNSIANDLEVVSVETVPIANDLAVESVEKVVIPNDLEVEKPTIASDMEVETEQDAHNVKIEKIPNSNKEEEEEENPKSNVLQVENAPISNVLEAEAFPVENDLNVENILELETGLRPIANDLEVEAIPIEAVIEAEKSTIENESVIETDNVLETTDENEIEKATIKHDSDKYEENSEILDGRKFDTENVLSNSKIPEDKDVDAADNEIKADDLTEIDNKQEEVMNAIEEVQDNVIDVVDVIKNEKENDSNNDEIKTDLERYTEINEISAENAASDSNNEMEIFATKDNIPRENMSGEIKNVSADYKIDVENSDIINETKGIETEKFPVENKILIKHSPTYTKLDVGLDEVLNDDKIDVENATEETENEEETKAKDTDIELENATNGDEKNFKICLDIEKKDDVEKEQFETNIEIENVPTETKIELDNFVTEQKTGVHNYLAGNKIEMEEFLGKDELEAENALAKNEIQAENALTKNEIQAENVLIEGIIHSDSFSTENEIKSENVLFKDEVKAENVLIEDKIKAENNKLIIKETIKAENDAIDDTNAEMFSTENEIKSENVLIEDEAMAENNPIEVKMKAENNMPLIEETIKAENVAIDDTNAEMFPIENEIKSENVLIEDEVMAENNPIEDKIKAENVSTENEMRAENNVSTEKEGMKTHLDELPGENMIKQKSLKDGGQEGIQKKHEVKVDVHRSEIEEINSVNSGLSDENIDGLDKNYEEAMKMQDDVKVEEIKPVDLDVSEEIEKHVELETKPKTKSPKIKPRTLINVAVAKIKAGEKILLDDQPESDVEIQPLQRTNLIEPEVEMETQLEKIKAEQESQQNELKEPNPEKLKEVGPDTESRKETETKMVEQQLETETQIEKHPEFESETLLGIDDQLNANVEIQDELDLLESQTEAQQNKETVAEQKNETETLADGDATAETERQAEGETQSEPETQAEVETQAIAETQAEAETQFEAERQAEIQVKTNVEIQDEKEIFQEETEMQSETKTEGKPLNSADSVASILEPNTDSSVNMNSSNVETEIGPEIQTELNTDHERAKDYKEIKVITLNQSDANAQFNASNALFSPSVKITPSTAENSQTVSRRPSAEVEIDITESNSKVDNETGEFVDLQELQDQEPKTPLPVETTNFEQDGVNDVQGNESSRIESEISANETENVVPGDRIPDQVGQTKIIDEEVEISTINRNADEPLAGPDINFEESNKETESRFGIVKEIKSDVVSESEMLSSLNQPIEKKSTNDVIIESTKLPENEIAPELQIDQNSENKSQTFEENLFVDENTLNDDHFGLKVGGDVIQNETSAGLITSEEGNNNENILSETILTDLNLLKHRNQKENVSVNGPESKLGLDGLETPPDELDSLETEQELPSKSDDDDSSKEGLIVADVEEAIDPMERGKNAYMTGETEFIDGRLQLLSTKDRRQDDAAINLENDKSAIDKQELGSDDDIKFEAKTEFEQIEAKDETVDLITNAKVQEFILAVQEAAEKIKAEADKIPGEALPHSDDDTQLIQTAKGLNGEDESETTMENPLEDILEQVSVDADIVVNGPATAASLEELKSIESQERKNSI